MRAGMGRESCRGEAGEAEEAQIEGRGLMVEEGGGEFADHGGEFEAVARTGTGDQDLGVGRVMVEDKVFVGGIGVHADNGGFQGAVRRGQKTAEQFAHVFYFVFRHVAADGMGLGVFSLMMDGDLHAVAEVGKAVEKTVWIVFPDMNGAVLRLKLLMLRLRLKPEEDLALD